MSSLDRDENLERLRAGGTWDVVVIGGGATGLGAAVDAAARGYRTALLEARDFAQGTSSRSTKLIHGGVRYLAQGDIPLVREALHERGLLCSATPRTWSIAATSSSRPIDWRDLPFYGIGLKALRPARRPLESRRLALDRAGRGRPADPDDRRPRAPRRDRLHRRPVRRRPAGDHPGPDVRRPGRHGAQPRADRRLLAPRRAHRRGRGPRRRDRRGTGDRGEGRRQRDRRLRRRGPPAGRSRHRRLAPADAQPGDAHRPRPLVPPRRDARSWSRTPTTAASCSRSPGTTGSWSGTTDTPVGEPAVEPHPRREEIAYLLRPRRALPGEEAAGRRCAEHVRRPEAAVARP